MTSFVALADTRVLERTCAELSAQFRFTKQRDGLWVPGQVLGMWVGAHSSIELRFQNAFGFPDRWMMVCLDEPGLTRADLLDMLVSRSVPASEVTGPRFLPVFSRRTSEAARYEELAHLRCLHPREVGAPLVMNPMTGAISPAVETYPAAGHLTRHP